MSGNSQSVVMEPEPLVIYDNPLLLCPRENVRNECAFVFETINNDIIPNSTLIFEPNFYQMSKEFAACFPAGNAFNMADAVPYRFENGAGDPSGKMQMMQIFYKNVRKDQPEFVDVNNLTSFEHVENKSPSKDSIVISDDENDVIFVKEYKKRVERTRPIFNRNDGPKEEGIRRNPVRKARITKGRRHLLREHLLEEDFDFLDEFDEDNLVFCKNKQSSSTNSTETYVKEPPKEWPINVFERPEYNPQTNKIEPFDYTIRDIQNKQLTKKPRLETCIKPKRKPKKKYIIRKRKPKSKKAVEKVPIKELKGVVSTTFEMVSSFLKLTNCDNENPRLDDSTDGLYDLLKTQTALMAVVNNYGEKEVSDCVSKLLSKS